ncbi:alpha/beta fold hydrolase [Mesonia aestuariivivens]|uniref:Alpha/beta fold hydrolase n=1 Tax=Mesonia aestuariivivens TaxID=2796128 RepID=A0ABS6W479_9FLAO|nr:alpha/beta fold hydrolase [Mesonia aestuariivivens]MBW2962671.1 alpha/beta fold hydrolase [Mesonia aestuariivivens]
MSSLRYISIEKFESEKGFIRDIELSYQLFGLPLGEAPVVMVNHALTGNSTLVGENGWFRQIVGNGKIIDLNTFTVLAFNVPGNGYGADLEDLIFNYKDFTINDISNLFIEGVYSLGIKKLFANIGCSIGGAITWHMAVNNPHLAENIIPIATHHTASDWVLANCSIQETILSNSSAPIEDARQHAMSFYRTPASLNQKFNREKKKGKFKVQDWLDFHGRALRNRYKLPAYRLMNHLLSTIDISNGSDDWLSVAKNIKAHIHIITINSDQFFLAEDNWNTYVSLSKHHPQVSIKEIKSIHGHDAFLIEHQQLSNLLQPIFQKIKNKNEKSTAHLVWHR